MKRKVGRIYCVDPRGPEALAQVDKAYNFTCPGGSLAFVADETIRAGKLARDTLGQPRLRAT